MKHYIAFWTIVFICLGCFPALGDEEKDATAQYEKNLERLEAGDINIDFKKFRLNCADSKYSCEADSDLMKKMDALLAENKYEEALEKANKALENVFVDIDLHFFAYLANRELGNEDKAKYHGDIIRGLLDSIQGDKNGRSPEEAFEVINVGEEYTFLRFSNMRVKVQSLIYKDRHSYDVMTCTNMEDNSEIEVYFNIDIPMKSLRNMMGGDE